ncbi:MULTISPECIES: histidine phosphatase family protein [Sorangium]|uniref:Phosphoglycerate mutase family protein n=1 Tax=Sorangium cellulosum (strain So ce56) TaxID=448385 RepID=A9GXE3_SORC5|nr:histidine phosphatase family protein [Sorangium cellulosum]CAN97079.1 Phosphoglycerate mutase family protein [Sorangium cellulosum So ce56]
MDPLAHGLVAFRHAPVALSGVCYGRLDVAAELPPEAAAAAIERALRELRVRPGVVFSSPLSRCALPAAELAARLGAPHAVDERLLEISYGAWEGRAFTDIERDDPAAYAAWLRDWERVGPPGGESAIEVESRVRSFWRELGAQRRVDGVDVADVASRARPHLLVAHAGVLRALRVVARGASWPAAMSAPVPHLTAERFPLPASALSLADL